MGTVGIRELKQNASAVVARAVEGETMTITDRGVPVARLTAIRKTWLEELVEQGRVTLPTKTFSDLPPPVSLHTEGPTMQEILDSQRADRF